MRVEYTEPGNPSSLMALPEHEEGPFFMARGLSLRRSGGANREPVLTGLGSLAVPFPLAYLGCGVPVAGHHTYYTKKHRPVTKDNHERPGPKKHWAPIHALWKIGCVWSALRFFSSFAMRKADRLAYRLSGPYDGRIVDWLGGANPTPRRLRPSPKSGAGRDARPSMQRSIPYLSLKNPEAVVSPTGRVPCLVALDQAPIFLLLSTNLFNLRFYSMLEHFCECYSDLSGPILCPVLGSITPLFIPNSRIRPIRLIGLCASLITFLYSPAPRIQFDPSTAKSQFVESLRWLPYENIHFDLGIDGISLFFVILTTFLIPICILVGWSGMRSYGKEYITASLIREFLMIAVFRMLDLLLFYVLPESVLIPMLCGAEHLLFAGIKLFLCRGLVQ
ncbi:hypothetical protein SADUNF_SadunfMtG0004800 (mitochondrion) [Salix dunnii]|nr:hypothetical protein SADUNF_SadunfMtG0004800 [Salix dunnii]